MIGMTGDGRVPFARFASLGSIWSQEARVMYVILLMTHDAADCGWLQRNAIVLLPRIDAERLCLSDPA
jgi:hypothetical protein